MFKTALIKPSSTKATKIALLRQETVFRIYLSGHRNQFLRPWSSIIQFLVLNCYLNLLLIFCPFESKADVFARIVWDQIIVSPVKPGTGREWTLNVFCCWCTCYLSFWAAKSFDKFYAHLKVFFDLLEGICWLKKLPLHQFLTVTDWKGSRPPSFHGPQVYSAKSHI